MMDFCYSLDNFMAQIRFLYKRVEGILQPIIPIGIKVETAWMPINVYVDSGAAYTILKASIAEEAGLNYRTGTRTNLQVGNGNLMPIYLHELEIQLGTERFLCPIGFSANLGVKFNVLGKTGIFDRFKVCFQQAQGCLYFETDE